jgi:hypothetical protein
LDGAGQTFHEEPRLPSLTVRVVYDDLPDLVEIEARVLSGDWSGVTCVYASPSLLAEGARGLLAWTLSPREEFILAAGADTGIGWFQLRCYAVDRAGHLACHVNLATSANGDRPEQVWRLSLEIPAETASVERFARQLIAVAETLIGEATLTGA